MLLFHACAVLATVALAERALIHARIGFGAAIGFVVASVLFAGDLVEQGAPPDFTDAHPLSWPAAVERLLVENPDTVVPGHGDPVAPGFVATQHAELLTVARLCHAVLAGITTDAQALTDSPYPAEPTRKALARARMEQQGKPSGAASGR
jgi:glyoxylase-like metal-dependent hydrolase (beta-lactamase superfamily II)